MKYRNQCVYKNVCNSSSQRCRSCELKFAPYDLNIAAQLKKDKEKSRYKFEDDRPALAADIMAQKSNNK